MPTNDKFLETFMLDNLRFDSKTGLVCSSYNQIEVGVLVLSEIIKLKKGMCQVRI